jgi:hypothetical protein
MIQAPGGQSSNLYFNAAHFSAPVLIRHLSQLKTVVLRHKCRICAIGIACVNASYLKASAAARDVQGGFVSASETGGTRILRSAHPSQGRGL